MHSGFQKAQFVMGVFIFGYGICRFFCRDIRESDPQFITQENPGAMYTDWDSDLMVSFCLFRWSF